MNINRQQIRNALPVMMAINSAFGGELDKHFFEALSETAYEAEYMEAIHASKSKSNSINM